MNGNLKKEELLVRTKKFAVRVYKFAESLDNIPSVNIVKRQIIRSSSSVASNYRASCRGKSKPDFLYKINIVEEEADESMFWLEFIREAEIKHDYNELEYLLKESNELTAIFTSIGKTTRQNLNSLKG